MKIYNETKRAAMYRNIKYWGKKPHNIWNELIYENTEKGDKVFDPFAGSNITFFESIALDRIPITMDINPLTSLITDVYSQQYNHDEIVTIFRKIKSKIEIDPYYKNFYLNGKCLQCGKINVVSNYIWNSNSRVEQRFKCFNCSSDNQIKLNTSTDFPIPNIQWMPFYDMRKLTLMKSATIKKMGGHNISYLYTDENLYFNTLIFDEITSLEEPYKKLFTLAFLQMIHLTTKMCAVRGTKTGRLYSSSWGRPAFLALTKYMEQNPIVQFERSIFGNNGILNALKSVTERIGNYDFEKYLNGNKIELIDVIKPTFISDSSEKNILADNTIDFIITDPPYGNIIQYGELSLVWNTWLHLMYPEYTISLDDEIIVNNKNSYEEYLNNLSRVFNNCYTYLKPGKSMIFTFNSNNEKDWDVLTELLLKSKFYLNNIYVQRNLRASEANVSARKGIAITDFYIVLKKDINIEPNTIRKNNITKIDELEKMWRIHNNG